MRLRASGKMALFIDGANLHYTARALCFDVDYKGLLEEFQRNGVLLRAFYYTTSSNGSEPDRRRPMRDWLDFNGFTVRTAPVKDSDNPEDPRRTHRALAVQIVVDAMEMAPHVKRIVLFTGDPGFCPLVKSLGRRGVYTAVASTRRTKPVMIANELRRQAHEFIELEALRSTIGRPLSSAPDRNRLGPNAQ